MLQFELLKALLYENDSQCLLRTLKSICVLSACLSAERPTGTRTLAQLFVTVKGINILSQICCYDEDLSTARQWVLLSVIVPLSHQVAKRAKSSTVALLC